MKILRQVIFWMHLTSGVTAGIFIFIMCITGALLSFESNIIEFAERDMRHTSPPAENAQKLSANEILAKIQTARPDTKPASITIKNEQDAAINISFGREGQVFVNPYTGEVTGEGAKAVRDAFRSMRRARGFDVGDNRPVGNFDGRGYLFFFFGDVRLYIWFPRRFYGSFRRFMVSRPGLSGKGAILTAQNRFLVIASLDNLTATAVVCHIMGE